MILCPYCKTFRFVELECMSFDDGIDEYYCSACRKHFTVKVQHKIENGIVKSTIIKEDRV